MSISKLRKTVQKRIKLAGWILAGLFFLSIPAYFSWGGGGLGGGGSVEAGDIAKINGLKITGATFERILSDARDRYPFTAGPESQLFLRLQIFNQIVDDIILSQALKQEKIKVSDKDVDKNIQEMIDKEVERAKKEQKGKTVNEETLRENLKKELENQREAVKKEVMVKKLREKLESRIKVTEEDLKNSYKEVHLRGFKVTDEKQAQELLEKAKTEDFSALVKQFATSASEKEKSGDMGWLPVEILPTDLQQKLAGMKKGDVAITRLGGAYYLIKLEDERLNLPKDFEKKKTELLKSYEERRKQSALVEYLDDLRNKAKIEIYDPLLKTAEAFQKGNWKKALEYIKEGLKGNQNDPNLNYLYGYVNEKLGNEDEAMKAYEKVALSVYMGQAYYRWGLLLEKKGKKKEAIEAFKKAGQYAGQDILLHMSLKEKFTSYGLTQEAKKQEEKIERLSAAQKLILGGGNGP